MDHIKMPKFIVKGFKGIELEGPFITAAENRKNTKMMIDNWKLGPESPSINPKDNKLFWSTIAKAWGQSEPEARRQMCSNCEYFKNDPLKQAKMESIPINEWDTGAGGRGYCAKFDFICHNLRTCQAWNGCDYD